MIACIIAAIESEADRSFMEELYIRNYGFMYKKALSILRSHSEAEDAVEAAMLRLIDRIPQLRESSLAARRSYLLACARNAAIDRLRRASKIYGFDDADARIEALPDDAPVDAALLRREQIQTVKRALMRLPDRERELLKMKYFDEMSDEEIAQLLGITRNNLRTRINRARQKLGAVLQEVESNDP